MDFVANLDTRLLQLSRHDYLTLRDAAAGVHCFGQIGSGKSTGPGQALAAAYLRAGMGGVVCCAKPEEITLWCEYARRNGRSKSLIIFDETQGINFLSYELFRQGINGLGSVVECLMHIVESANQAMGAGGQPSDPFWNESVRQVLYACVPLIFSATGDVTVKAITDFVTSAATNAERYTEPGFAEQSFAARTLRKAVDRPVIPIPAADQRTLLEYWFLSWPGIPEKTRGNICISLTTKLDRFTRGRLRDCYCGKTTIVPEMTWHGAIILLAQPALTWAEDGILGQQLFKYLWCRATESRNALERRHRERPVFLWADESQYFVNDKDEAFLSTCRASRACVVYLTQTLPTYYARMGAQKRDAAQALVGKFTSQIFCASGCSVTNQYASELIGRGVHYRATEGRSAGTSFSRGMNEGANANRGASSSSGSSYGPGGGSFNNSSGGSSGSGEQWGANVGRGTNESESWSRAEQMDNLVEPRYFATELKTGGPAHGKLVTALWFKAGARFIDGNGNVLLTTFKQ